MVVVESGYYGDRGSNLPIIWESCSGSMGRGVDVVRASGDVQMHTTEQYIDIGIPISWN